MLTNKEEEIDKLRAKLSQLNGSVVNLSDSSVVRTNSANYDLDSGYESSVSTTVRK